MARDRGPDGRARNSRPRDELGRPLEFGSTGVERAAEGAVRPPVESLSLAQELLDQGRPFHAHEVLEDAWKQSAAAERELWRGLAQLAVGLTHRARGNDPGARTLLLRGADTIAPFAESAPYDIDVVGLIDQARALADQPVEADAGLTLRRS